MSSADTEILQAAFAAMADGDATALLRIAAEDVRLYPRPEEPGVRSVYVGWEGWMEYATNWYSQWEEYDLSALEFLDVGDRVIVVLLERGRMQRSGIEIEQEFSHSFTMRDGRIVEWRMYDSHDQALAAVGLRE
jgi:ketosteroid isomerase-like protein